MKYFRYESRMWISDEHHQKMLIQHFLNKMASSTFHTQHSLAQTEFIACPFLTIIKAFIPEEASNAESHQGGPTFHYSIIQCGLPTRAATKNTIFLTSCRNSETYK